ncbi:MAG TPA: DEAD/DEAH box helicase [Candidatus Wujingus californicus]|uniref:DEAD/DEAH box helicase n=1 Tax=Candidatus Wujingus californicus TaxID=3367618 RepID=UPI001E194B61|nr:DEAD/DEAH box helicase family protein [Planctomycetota bacterium]MDO8131902.1 DEAD/DEAH box helicase family protein [Candidatus Brocadiales bacterium]
MIADKLKIEMKLRDAQYDSLTQLEDVMQRNTIAFKKGYTENELKNLYKTVFRRAGNFHYDFSSFCFALATGVGKTKLLGACIYALYKEKGYRNFFVIAPNKTIYDKFIREFNEKNEKYIFEGITDLPKFRVVSGADFNKINTKQSSLGNEEFIVYVFNIDKFKSEERVLQVKKINEYLGASFYEYISNLSDLVVLMDESHKYKTSIAVNAINGLKPILGLEFTATPFKKITENEKSEKFDNILYEYSLGAALSSDNPVLKRPQLLLRRDFKYEALSKKDLYDVLISDGIDNHERIKTMLEAYFTNENSEQEKRFLPLVLIVCENIHHAIQVEKHLKEEFQDGKYKDKIVRIHSTPQDNKELPKEEKYDEDTEVEKLLALEKSTNPYEIIINVNKLGLGWDVKNVYTIVPLRAFDSQVFVEQTIGRGLRLPFGKWIEEGELDTLRIAYHSNFGKVIQRADAWLQNMEVIEPPKKQMVPYTLKIENKDMGIPIPFVGPKVEVGFTLKYFEPKVPAHLEDIEVSRYVKDLATREEKEIGKIEERLNQSPKEYILSRLIGLPSLSIKEIPVIEKIVDRYLDLLGKKGQPINLENRLKIVNDIYGQIKEKIGEKTAITYRPTERTAVYSEYETSFGEGYVSEDYEKWDDNETKRGLVTGYKRSIYKENVFDSRQERIVAKVLERDREVMKWFRPYKKDNFSIVYQFKGDRHDYVPDFIAETENNFYIIEPKSKDEMDDSETKAKAKAALEWIKEMNKASKKKWEYLLIPHDRITSSVNSLKKLINQAINLDDI